MDLPKKTNKTPKNKKESYIHSEADTFRIIEYCSRPSAFLVSDFTDFSFFHCEFSFVVISSTKPNSPVLDIARLKFDMKIRLFCLF